MHTYPNEKLNRIAGDNYRILLQYCSLLEEEGYWQQPREILKRRIHDFLALYVHYLYVLGKIEKRQYPPRMTPQLRKEVIRFERCREQFAFLRENGIATQEDMAAFQTRTEDTLIGLMKQRTILNVRKKKRRSLYDALADVEALEEYCLLACSACVLTAPRTTSPGWHCPQESGHSHI